MSTLRMEFKPENLLTDEKPLITQYCRTVRDKNWGELGSSTTAIVYSSSGRWWHTTTNDPKEHVTVRYDRRVPATRRVHIYKDGSANLFPHTGVRQTGEASDGSVELSDEDDIPMDD